MRRLAGVVAVGIPHHVAQRGDLRRWVTLVNGGSRR